LLQLSINNENNNNNNNNSNNNNNFNKDKINTTTATTNSKKNTNLMTPFLYNSKKPKRLAIEFFNIVSATKGTVVLRTRTI